MVLRHGVFFGRPQSQSSLPNSDPTLAPTGDLDWMEAGVALSIVGSGGIAGLVNTTAQFTAPAAVNADDLFIMWVVTSTYDPPAPAGWTNGPTLTVSGSMRCEAFWKWATGSEDSTTQGWTPTTEWTTSAGKGIAWACIRGVDKTAWTALSDANRFETASSTSASTLNVPTQTVSGGDFGAVSFWNERSSTPVASPQPTEPSGYTRTTSMTYRTGTGICSGSVAWDLDPETTSVGSGAWSGFSSSSGIGLLTVALPIASSVATVTLTPVTVTATATSLSPAGQGAVTLTPVSLSLTVPTTTPVGSSPVTQLNYPIYIAHRGGANISNRAENTVTAFLASIADDHPATILEADCAGLATGGGYTAEQRIALTHEGDDLTTNSRTVESDGTTVVTGTSASKTVAQWDSYLINQRTGISGGPKPASRWYTGEPGNPGLADLLLANPTKIAMPEVKEPEALTPLIDSIIARGLRGRTIVQSFDYTEAQTIAAAGLNALYLVAAFTSPTATQIYDSGIRWVGIDRTNASLASLTTTAHAAGLKVIAYTVNSTSNQATALAAGVDGMFTDRPDIVNGGGFVALTPVSVTLTPQTVTPVPQPITITLTPVTGSVSVPAVTPVPQPVAITLTPVTATATARPLTAAPGLVTMALTPVALAVQATPLAPAGAGSVALTPVSLSITARPLTSQPGLVTTSLTPAVTTVTPVALGSSAGVASVTLTPVSVTVTTPEVTPVPEAVVIALTPVLVAITATALDSTAGEVTITLTAVQVAVAAVVLSASGTYTGPGTFTFTGELTAPTILSGSLS